MPVCQMMDLTGAHRTLSSSLALDPPGRRLSERSVGQRFSRPRQERGRERPDCIAAAPHHRSTARYRMQQSFPDHGRGRGRGRRRRDARASGHQRGSAVAPRGRPRPRPRPCRARAATGRRHCQPTPQQPSVATSGAVSWGGFLLSLLCSTHIFSADSILTHV